MALVAAAVGVLEAGLLAWFVADDFVHLGYMHNVSHPWRFWHHPVLGTMIFRPLAFTAKFYFAYFLGFSPTSIHGTDMAIHCLNTVLVFILVYRLLMPRAGVSKTSSGDGANLAREEADAGIKGKSAEALNPIYPALGASLIFAVHPVSSLTACWFACRSDLIATFFSLLTLILVAGMDKPKNATLISIFVLGLAAMLSKVTHGPLFMAAFFLSLARNWEGPLKKRIYVAAVSALPVFNASLIYLSWRFLALKSMGGYQSMPSSLIGVFNQLWYHLPRVWLAAGRDFLVHHMDRDHDLFIPLIVSLCVLLAAGGIGALARQRRLLVCGLAFGVAMILPAWNLSHMFAAGEERLLYFPLVGFVMIGAALVAGPRHRALRAAALGSIISAGIIFGFYSRICVEDWKIGAEQNHKLARSLADHIEEMGMTDPVRRIYVLGLGLDQYYLDTMILTELSPAFHDREVMLGDRDSFLWWSAESGRGSQASEDVPRSARPTRTNHITDRQMLFQTAKPPDLLEAAARDRGARILEWNGSKLKDITQDLKKLYSRRLFIKRRYRNRRTGHLPSFNFRKSPLAFKWELSPGLQMDDPVYTGTPYSFIAENRDPYLISAPLSFRSLTSSAMTLEMKLPRRQYLPPNEELGCVSWETKKQPWFSPERNICFPVIADGQIHNYKIDLLSNIHWARSGVVTRLRLDPISYQDSFELIRLELLALEQ